MSLWNTVFAVGRSSPKAVKCAQFVSGNGLNFNLHENKSDLFNLKRLHKQPKI